MTLRCVSFDKHPLFFQKLIAILEDIDPTPLNPNGAGAGRHMAAAHTTLENLRTTTMGTSCVHVCISSTGLCVH